MVPTSGFRAALTVLSVSALCHGGVQPHEPIDETYTVDQQVDSSRYVDEATASNTMLGDTVLHFTATRTDQAGIDEHWCITYEYDIAHEFTEHLSIDGVWQWTVRSAIVDGLRQVTLITPEGSATMVAACPNHDSTTFRALAAATAGQRAVVDQVAHALDTHPGWPLDPTPSFQDCLDGCGPEPPLSCPPIHGAGDVCDCINTLNCCTDSADLLRCQKHCHCEHNVPEVWQYRCWYHWEFQVARAMAKCSREFMDCLAHTW